MLTYYNNYVPLVQLKTINMPRQARKTSGTGIYHVMLRGINRQNRSENRPLIYQVKTFVAQHPDATQDPLYPEIQKNIKANLLRLSITIDDEWDGETFIEY